MSPHATTINIYDYGQRVSCSVTFATPAPASIPVDPAVVFFRVRKPDKTVENYQYPEPGVTIIVRDDTGDYHADVDTDQEGDWFYRFEGTGPAAGAGENYFGIKRTRFY
jgi:hypothetical protein